MLRATVSRQQSERQQPVGDDRGVVSLDEPGPDLEACLDDLGDTPGSPLQLVDEPGASEDRRGPDVRCQDLDFVAPAFEAIREVLDEDASVVPIICGV
jgi:hypothetical protein